MGKTGVLVLLVIFLWLLLKFRVNLQFGFYVRVVYMWLIMCSIDCFIIYEIQRI